ncbi:hypothetical protein [Streptomyces avidinii]|uniref:PE family protein n=1 Tax=Streptomyces avidinii TaxID=1895 RepID=A0ABS4L3E8_STRAV|nr:hypothetical protein [Streptomyces avidinii]MBP2036324.1 hypothetical protein [Streptomyces avidinii]GGY82402.1 hypothetical protein GCM10010343_03960 [Streptomyces avidinii]
MSDHPARAAAAAAHIRDLAEATTDPRHAYATPAEIAAVTGSLRELGRHLEDALRHLEVHIGRRDDGDWAAPDGARPRPYARQAGGAVQSARAEARNMVRALDRAMEALGPFKPAP